MHSVRDHCPNRYGSACRYRNSNRSATDCQLNGSAAYGYRNFCPAHGHACPANRYGHPRTAHVDPLTHISAQCHHRYLRRADDPHTRW